VGHPFDAVIHKLEKVSLLRAWVNQQQADAQEMFPEAIGVALDDRFSG
jgi:hypothetical protein